MIRASIVSCVVIGVALALCGVARAADPVALTVGATNSTSDAPIYIADKKGYFSDEGLAVTVSNFRSAADMVAPLGVGRALQRGVARRAHQDCRRQGLLAAGI